MKPAFARNFLLAAGLKLDMNCFQKCRLGLSVLAALMLLGGRAMAQIAIQDGSPITITTYTNTAAFPITQSVTVTPGASVLVVLLEARDANFGNDTGTPTWNGTPLTLAVQS